MPCDIGIRSVTRINIPSVQPQEFEEEIKPPEIDRDLLDKIGEDDQVFLEWLGELEIGPLLEEALRRAKSRVENSDSLSIAISKNGRLVIKSSYTNAREKRQIETVANMLSARFQMEVLAIIAELLDYRISLNQQGRGEEITFILEGEKEAVSGVGKYLRITKDTSEDGALMFEHFESKKALTSEQYKFLGLSQKLGVKIFVEDTEYSGQAISREMTRKDILREI